jgi:hypothetical protein
MRKLLLGTAIAMVLATASYAQTYTADDAAQAAKSLADVPNPDDLLNGVSATSDTPDSKFADAWDMYNLVADYECRDQTVELVILALTEDSEWIRNYLASGGGGPVLIASSSRPKTKTEYHSIQIFLTILKDKPVCPTPGAPAQATPGGGNDVPQPPPRVDVPPPLSNPDAPQCWPTPADKAKYIEDLEYRIQRDEQELNKIPEYQKVNADYIQSLKDDLQQLQRPDRYDPSKPSDDQYEYTPEAWERIQDLQKSIQISTDYIDMLNADQQQYQQEIQDAKAKLEAAAKPYCPPPSDGTSSNLPSGDGTQSQVAHSTPGDPANALPSQPWWFRSMTPPSASDQVFNGKPDSDNPTQPSKTDDKTSEKSNPNGNGEMSDSRSAAKTDSSTDRPDAKPTGNGKHANAKSAGAGEHANTKAEGNNEHTMRSGAHEKADVSQHVTRANDAGHMSGMRASGMRKGGMGGMHAGGLGGMRGMHMGGVSGVLGMLGGLVGR